MKVFCGRVFALHLADGAIWLPAVLLPVAYLLVLNESYIRLLVSWQQLFLKTKWHSSWHEQGLLLAESDNRIEEANGAFFSGVPSFFQRIKFPSSRPSCIEEHERKEKKEEVVRTANEPHEALNERAL